MLLFYFGSGNYSQKHTQCPQAASWVTGSPESALCFDPPGCLLPRVPKRESSVDQGHGELWCIETQVVPGKTDVAVNQGEKQAVLTASQPRSWYLEPCWTREQLCYERILGFSPILAKSSCPAQEDGNPKLNIKMSFRLESCFVYFRFLWNQMMQWDLGLPGQINRFGES